MCQKCYEIGWPRALLSCASRWRWPCAISGRLHDDAEPLSQDRTVLVFGRQQTLLTNAIERRYQAKVTERDAPVWQCERADALLGKMRVGRGLLIDAALCEVCQRVWLKREAVDRFPL